MLKRLKERFLGDDRTIGAITEIKSLYDTAYNEEAFHAALAEGDIEEAAEHHPLSADELHERFDQLLNSGMDLADEYSEVLDQDKEDFINA